MSLPSRQNGNASKSYTSQNFGKSYHPMNAFGLENTVSGQKEDESTISEIAREFNITLRALRFYEDRGLISPRRLGQTRLYSQNDKERLKHILKAKKLGFTLTEIRDFLEENAGKNAPRADTQEDELGFALRPEQIINQIAHLERQRVMLDEAIAQLQATHQKLAESSSAA